MFTELETDRFWLKEILPEDQAFIFKGLSHPDVIPFYGVHYKSFEETKAQMDWYASLQTDNTGCWWKIVDKQTNEPVGACGINFYNATHEKAEIGYWLLPGFWKKGIMNEVIPVMIKYLFDNWKLNRLESVVEEGNESSIKLSEKLGFVFEGKQREVEMKNGKPINLLMYSLLRSDKNLSH